MVLRNLRQTCYACPSQWEALTEDGQFVYIRYRWGQLTLGVGDTLTEAVGNVSFSKQVGDSLDGAMSIWEVQRHIPKLVIPHGP